MPIFEDQCGRLINLETEPRRIISLVPSQTELLADLGLEDSVVGITKFCIHPENWFRNKTRVGGTKNVDAGKIKALCPDLIIANKEENRRDQIEILEKIAPVWVSDVNTFEDALAMIQNIGELTGTAEKAQKIITDIRFHFSLLTRPLNNGELLTAYLIWKEPYMAAGGDTFISSIMKQCGLTNVFEDTPRYPETSITLLKEKNTKLILLSSEPYPFQQKHIKEIKEQIPEASLVLADGEMFSWYGSRMLHAAEYLQHFIRENISNI